jgi:hypothetical protein
MKNKILIIALFLIAIQCFSQSLGGTDQTNTPVFYNINIIDARKNYVSTFFSEVDGTPYIFKNFVLSEIEGVKNKMMLRYNAYDDVIELEKSVGQVFTVSKDFAYGVIYMSYDRKKLRLISTVNKKNEPVLNYAFELVNNEKLALLRRDKIELKEAKLARNSFEFNTKAKFTDIKSSYLLEFKDKKTFESLDSKSKLLELYPAHNNEIKAFLKENKIDFSKESDLLQTTQFLTNLTL